MRANIQPSSDLPDESEVKTSRLFTKASGTSVAISADAYKKGSLVLARVDNYNGDEQKENIRNSYGESIRSYKGGESDMFQTASGKNVMISESAKAKADKLLGSSSGGFDIDPLMEIVPESVVPKSGRKSDMFQTASGKNVMISESAKAKADKLIKSSMPIVQSPCKRPNISEFNVKEIKQTNKRPNTQQLPSDAHVEFRALRKSPETNAIYSNLAYSAQVNQSMEVYRTALNVIFPSNNLLRSQPSFSAEIFVDDITFQ